LTPTATGQADSTLISGNNVGKQKSSKIEELFHDLINLILDEFKAACSSAISLDPPSYDFDLPPSGLVPRA